MRHLVVLEKERAIGPCANVPVPMAARPRVLLRGAVHPAVRDAQRRLNEFHAAEVAAGRTGLAGAPLVESCVFEQATQHALIAFQQQVFPGLPAQHDGRLGPKTWAEFDRIAAFPSLRFTFASLETSTGEDSAVQEVSGWEAESWPVPVAKEYILPNPETKVWSRNLDRHPQVSTLPLYIKGAPPNYSQIKQQNIGNCYVAATLAAMANTKAGRRQIARMITAHSGSIVTTCKNYESFNVEGLERRLASGRWFAVAFRETSVDVSDVLYHDDSDKDPNLIYMTTPGGDRALWGAVIEVAYAKLKGGYDHIGGGMVSVNQFLDEFSAVKWAILDPLTDMASIKVACRNAGRRPAIIATKGEGARFLSAWHGYAVLGMNGEMVELWDPLSGKREEIKFQDLLTEVQAVARQEPQ